MAFICPRDVVFVVSWTNIPNNHQIIWKFAEFSLSLPTIKVLTEFFDSLTDLKKPRQGVATQVPVPKADLSPRLILGVGKMDDVRLDPFRRLFLPVPQSSTTRSEVSLGG